MTGRDELIVLIGQAIREELAGLSVFPDEYRFGDEAEAVLEALEQVGYVIVRADRLIEVSSVSTLTGNPGTWGKREEERAE